MQPGLGVDVSLVPFFRVSSAWLKGRIFDAKTKEITNISYLLQNRCILSHCDLCRKNENMTRFQRPSISWWPCIKTNAPHLLPSVDFFLPLLFCLHNNPFHTETTTSVHTPMSCRASVVKTWCSNPLLEGSHLELLNVQETCSNCLVKLCRSTVQSKHVFTSTLIRNCSKGFIKDQNSLKLTLKAIGCESNWSPISHGKCNTCFDPLSGLTHNPVFKVTFQGQTGKLFSLTCTSKLFTTFNLAIRFTGFTAELHAIFLGHLLKCRLEPSSCCIVLGIVESMHLQHMLVALKSEAGDFLKKI